jgi:hypothetical protein
MLQVLYAYLAFALATGLVSWLYLFNPCLKEAQLLGIQNEITQSPKLTGVVWVLINTLLAPVVFLIVLVPTFYQAALVGVRRSMLEE